MRSDRSISTHGLEPRTPFLDKQFVAVARAVATEYRMRPEKEVKTCNEKWILRVAFEDTGLLPYDVLWRRKEAFSDGVSVETKSWYEEIQERLENSDGEMKEKYVKDWEERSKDFAHLTPYTAESFYYRSIFHELYGYEA